jgi:hypothetical protein
MKIDFEKSEGNNVFKDALELENDHNLSDDEIEAMKQLRFDAWLEIIKTPPEEVI